MNDSHALIHADLSEEASWGISSLYESWKRDGRVDPFLIIWPSKDVQFNGESVNDSIPFQLPTEQEAWGDFIARTAKDNAAWALMLVQQKAQSVVVTFESPVGTKSWHIPIQKVGVTRSLGVPIERVDTDYLGIKWRPPTAGEAQAMHQ